MQFELPPLLGRLPDPGKRVRLGVAQINLTGGEILAHPDWYRILRVCTSHSGVLGVCLQTNATLITSAHLEALMGLRLEKLTIQVSLDGARARTHDLVRGPGSYAQAMAGLRQLVQAGLGPHIQVAFTEMAHNFSELPELLEKIDKMGIRRLIGSTLVKGGRAAASTRIGLPTPVQYRELIQLYQTDAAFKALYDQRANVAAIEWFKSRSAPGDAGCSCLKDVFVDAGGHVYPCTMLLLSRYASQSIYAHPPDQVLQKALAVWRELPLLSRRRPGEIQQCLRCPHNKHCGGGCMGRAAVSCGEPLAPEDRCALRKAVYNWTMLPGAGAFNRKS
jgi:AdoMet-dependent heme synthase